MKRFDYSRTALSPAARNKVIAGLGKTTYDLVVVGAGVTGAGVALDAVLRGLRVLLIDKHDIAFGTSRWSSKLAHGGLRYLASGNVGIARRSARERGTLMTVTAPHLTRALPQVVPVMSKFSVANRVLPRVGFLAGDALRMLARTSGRVLPPSRTISARRVAELCPSVGDVSWGYVNYDGQLIDDARLVMALARTAAGYGTDVLTGAEAVSESEIVIDNSPTPTCITTRSTVNATGVWAGGLSPQVTVTPSRGTHLVVSAAAVGNPSGALTVPVPGETNRFCFILPAQLGRCYVGLTDELAPSIDDVPAAPEEDIDFVLDVVNQALRVPLQRSDVLGTFAGLRPLVQLKAPEGASSGSGCGSGEDAGEGKTADLSREHLILREGNMVTVTGGKLTEYRLMAEQTVDEVLKVLAENGGAASSASADSPCVSGASGVSRQFRECTTAATPLVGAVPPENCGRAVADSITGSWLVGSTAELRDALVSRYGEEAPNVIAMSMLARPWEPVAPGIAVTRAEFSFAVTHEGARSLEDILDRRTRIGMVPADREAAEPAAREALAAAGL